LERKVDGKATTGDLLKQVQKTKGHDLPELDAPTFPDILAHLWECFLEIHVGRSYGMNGPNPISYESINCYQTLSGIELTWWDVETVKLLDSIWIKSTSGD